jgi:hypothetical protein
MGHVFLSMRDDVRFRYLYSPREGLALPIRVVLQCHYLIDLNSLHVLLDCAFELIDSRPRSSCLPLTRKCILGYRN